MRRRICWDTMLFIHFFEGNGPARLQVAKIFLESVRRNDELFASCLSIGELFAGARLMNSADSESKLRRTIHEMNFSLLPFNESAIDIFAELRAASKVKAPDAINLACAGAGGIDLFLTADRALYKLDVPGIKFIARPEDGLI